MRFFSKAMQAIQRCSFVTNSITLLFMRLEIQCLPAFGILVSVSNFNIPSSRMRKQLDTIKADIHYPLHLTI